jgi:hypothetical protein
MTIPVAQANGEMPDTAHVVSQEGSASVEAKQLGHPQKLPLRGSHWQGSRYTQ